MTSSENTNRWTDDTADLPEEPGPRAGPVRPFDVQPDDDADDQDEWESGYADERDEEDPEDGGLDLAERHALRRVAGLSTELDDITEVEYRQLRLERVVLVGVWTDGSRRRRGELAGRAGPARRDGGLGGARRALPAAAEPRPGHVHRPRQGGRAARDRGGHRRRHGDLRRRALARPAAQPGGPRQGQGRRPDRADPGHLRPARQVAGGQGAGRAGPAELPDAAAARLGWQPVPPGRRPGRLAGRRHRWPRPR